MNSPVATSVEVLVLLTSGTVGEEENHPPGKNRDIADSVLFREPAATGSSGPWVESDVFTCSWEGLDDVDQNIFKARLWIGLLLLSHLRFRLIRRERLTFEKVLHLGRFCCRFLTRTTFIRPLSGDRIRWSPGRGGPVRDVDFRHN